ncbi:hypothetical protein NPX13_g11178 [Xylaria arbuscula]|uniref:Uncharacterized protein n=1 Tax=Xylaria arbuscula TaxID=114810 RepID=A0A9W8TH82_9PEZI|nr:hypothetical protein NPX13_g11178 [Xylaria arbuscula]
MAVLSDGQDEGDEKVAPEGAEDEPSQGSVVLGDDVALRARDDGGEGEKEGGEEEPFARMRDRVAEIVAV